MFPNYFRQRHLDQVRLTRVECSDYSRQITIIPEPKLRAFWEDSPTKPPFQVTSAEVAIICPVIASKQFFVGEILRDHR